MALIKRYRDILLGVAIGAFLVTAVIAAGSADGATEWSRLLPFSQQNLLIMRQARSILEQYHVDDTKAPDEEKLFFGSMQGMVSAVEDPYTRFVAPEQLREENMEMEGEYGGLGMYIGQRDGKILVISPIEETPADRAGVKPMDEIVKVDEKVVVGMHQNDVVKMLRGAPDTSVTVWMRRKDEEELKSFKMTREIINIKTVRFEMIDQIAYIRLNNFHHKTAIELEDAVREAAAKNASGIVLDMRNNPGGLLNIAVDVASLFRACRQHQGQGSPLRRHDLRNQREGDQSAARRHDQRGERERRRNRGGRSSGQKARSAGRDEELRKGVRPVPFQPARQLRYVCDDCALHHAVGSHHRPEGPVAGLRRRGRPYGG